MRPILSLDESPDWPMIVALVHVDLSLSFNSTLQAQLFLPDVYHIATMLAGTGSPSMKIAVHTLVINTMHSLRVALAGMGDAYSEKTGAIDLLLIHLRTSDWRAAFGMTPLSPEQQDAADTSSLASVRIEPILEALIQSADVGAPTMGKS